MRSAPASSATIRWTLLLLRWVLGGVFLYMGAVKALHPVDFLKVLHEYGFFHSALALNSIAAVLPWLEIFCGLLLLGGVAVSGSALLILAMLIPFTAAVAHRAVDMGKALSIPFCAVRFDCGCGSGEVNICRKLLENGVLMAMAAILLFFVHWRARTADESTGGKNGNNSASVV